MAASRWREVRLGDLVSITHGWPFHSEAFAEFRPGLPIVVGIGNFQYSGGFRFDSTTLKAYVGTFPTQFVLRPGDILLVMTCQTPGGEILGIPGRIPDDGRVYLHNQRMGKVVVTHPNEIDDGFLYWMFRSRAFNQHLTATASGTKILHTSPGRIEDYRFYLPPLVEQHTIAHILGTLDDKIGLSQRMNETLEAMTRALFTSWFVDFDPVRAKAEGRQAAGLDTETAALFPDTIEESELGAIPQGWHWTKAGSVCSIGRALVNPALFPEEVFDHYSIPAFDDGRVPKVEHGEDIKSNKFLVSADAVLASKLNPHIPRVWLPWTSSERRSICSTEFLVTSVYQPATREYLYALLSSSSFQQEFASLVTGTTGSHQRVQPEHLLNQNVLLPATELIQRFTSVAQPLYARAGRNLHESTTLAAIRDALLPKLLSGELRVKDAEQVIEEVLA